MRGGLILMLLMVHPVWTAPHIRRLPKRKRYVRVYWCARKGCTVWMQIVALVHCASLCDSFFFGRGESYVPLFGVFVCGCCA
ncbi:hypothetical protein EJ05DRAFT_82030 [Pseudovirgaria hyperparasitica]|uniref:Secreted protein n=1 Tax=Pseudovirgaria hyperparasitica TaxID=470096 RepID=A0A6A6W047_9PEZI|nr:uncharacterized protein EJ05DRAFT_82030 [Pseudovirgaria hyperparasitica]KAF2755913.1 hypothetical protein EJ05DRAFT_82030 [Pseudovirgaria hyperparasitica]